MNDKKKKKKKYFLTKKTIVWYLYLYVKNIYIHKPPPSGMLSWVIYGYTYVCIVVEYYEGVWIRVDRQYETSINKKAACQCTSPHFEFVSTLSIQTPYLWGFWYHRYQRLRRHFLKKSRDLCKERKNNRKRNIIFQREPKNCFHGK